jgi:hypothetical protein
MTNRSATSLPESADRRRTAAHLVALLVLASAAGLLYFARLGAEDAYLSIEELTAAHQSLSLATTGRSLSGQWLPMYVGEPGYEAGRDPVWIYVNAALLKVWPFSETLIRSPSAAVGVLDVVLMFLVIYRLFGGFATAMIGAALLAITPAHFFQSRIATSQIGPIAFVLAWLWLLLRFFATHRLRDLWLSTACLGAGVYSYLAAAFMMPCYFLATLIALAMHSRSAAVGGDPVLWRRTAWRTAAAGFFLLLLPWIAWHAIHPERFLNLAAYYTGNGYNPDVAGRFDPIHLMISRFSIWWEAFNPERFFFAGDSNLRFSTRRIGYLLLPTIVLLGIGVVNLRRLVSAEARFLVLCGILLAPLPAVLAGDNEIKRWLTILPFVTIVAACGSHVLLRTRQPVWRVVLCAVLAASAWQFSAFTQDYWGEYRARSSYYFFGNLRGAIRQVLASDPVPDCVLLDGRLPITAHWRFYTTAFGRPDLAGSLNLVDPERVDFAPPAQCENALLVSLDDRLRENPSYNDRLLHQGWKKTTIPEPDGKVSLVVLRRVSGS